MDSKQFTDLVQAVGRMEGKLDSHLERVEDHETRLRAIETESNRGAGRTGVIVALVGFAAGAVGPLVSWLAKMKGTH